MTAPRFVRSTDFVSTDMDGETVMMSIEHGSYFGISGVGTLIWDLLAEPQTTESLTDRLCGEYDVDDATARRDVEAFLAKLAEHGLTRPA